MQYFKRKDGSVFGKMSPRQEQVEAYVKEGRTPCDSEGNVNKSKPKPKKKSK